MKVIVGLGNPGAEYDKTRHNAGFVVLDRVVERLVDSASRAQMPKGRFQGLTREVLIGAERCLLLKPTTFMNLSGRSVGEAVNFYKVHPKDDLLVIMDDVSLPTGSIRVRAGGSAGGHNGLRDIERALGTQEYPRLRIGIDACPPVMKLEEYVLGRFTEEQRALLGPAIERAVEAVEVFVLRGTTAAMNKYNPPASVPKASEARKQADGAGRPETNKNDVHPGWLEKPPAGEER